MKLSDHVAMAEHRIEKSRRIIERQRERIAKHRASGRETATSEKVLAALERSHAALQSGLIVMLKDQARDEPPHR